MQRAEPLAQGDAATAATALARAFADDPGFRWLLPDRVERETALGRFYPVLLSYALRYGRVAQLEKGSAVALWLPPAVGVSAWGMVRSGALRVPFVIGFSAFWRILALDREMGRLHRAHAPDPHWYLMVIGVEPSAQRRGLGSTLLREGLARADAEDVPVYLETSQPTNVPLYEALGFAVKEELCLAGEGPRTWAMYRVRQSARNRR